MSGISTVKRRTAFDAGALAVFVRQEGGFRRVRSEAEEHAVYYTVYARQNASYVDILNPAVVRQFIEQTHEVYYRRFSGHFGRTVQGFLPMSHSISAGSSPEPVVPQAFSETYGYDVLDGLIALFYEEEKNAAAFRNDFWKLMNRLLMELFQKAVYDWCKPIIVG